MSRDLELTPVRVVRIGGVDVPETAMGNFDSADLTINQAGDVDFDIEARGAPLGTTVTITMFSETLDFTTVESTPLTGTVEQSTATATTAIPHGFNRFYVEANWTQ